jgi:hypothetical protein
MPRLRRATKVTVQNKAICVNLHAALRHDWLIILRAESAIM